MLNDRFSGLQSKKWGLRTKAIALASLISTLPVLGIGSIAYYLANRSITTQVLESKKDQAIALSNQVNQFMFERYGDIQTLATQEIFADPRISKLVPAKQQQETLDRYLQVYQVYDSIAIADLAGNTILQSTGSPVTGLGQREYFQEVIKTNHPSIPAPRNSALTGEYSVFVAAPIKNLMTGKTIGVIRARIPVKRLADNIRNILSIQEDYQIINPQGEVFISNKLEDVGKLAQSAYAFFPQVQIKKQAIARVAKNQRYPGKKVVAIAPTQNIAQMPNLNWVVLIDLDTATAFQTQKELLTTLLLGTLITALIVSAIAVFLANRATQSINEIVKVVADASSEIATTVEQQAYTANQQVASVNQTSITMDELLATSKKTAEQATAAATGADQVLSLVNGSTSEEWKTLTNAANLRSQVEQISEEILRLSEQISQIYTITNLVSDLAHQTHILALNAAVEAARAGDQGKGFAVVATEISRLANQSQKSAEKINSLVRQIQESTHITVMATDEGRKTVHQVVGSINNITVNAQQIALTAKQQAIAIQQVVEAMSNINQGASQTASSISQTKISTENLNQAASALRIIV